MIYFLNLFILFIDNKYAYMIRSIYIIFLIYLFFKNINKKNLISNINKNKIQQLGILILVSLI